MRRKCVKKAVCVKRIQASVASARIRSTGEKIDVPRPQFAIHWGAMPPGRGSITRFIPDIAK